MMWSKGVLGGNNPRNLNHTVFYLLSLHYGTEDVKNITKCTSKN